METHELVVHTEPTSAYVEVFDHKNARVAAASGPRAAVTLKRGQYTAKVSLAGYVTRKTQVTVPKNRNVAVSLEREPPPPPPQAEVEPTYSESSYSSSSGDYESVPTSDWQCQAITRRGRQCSRNAQEGRAYCWQHP